MRELQVSDEKIDRLLRVAPAPVAAELSGKISGALTVAIDLNQMASGAVTGSDIHDNAGPALAVRSGASP